MIKPPQPPDWDWVRARAACSAVAMFEVLRGVAKANMATRNELRGPNDRLGDRFRFEDHALRGFMIFDTWSQDRRAVEADVTGDVITLAVSVQDASVTLQAKVTLNDSGQCKLKVGSDELDPWQVLKRALEPLFF